MDYCTNCGARLNPASRFCGACGTPADAEETRYASEQTRLAPQEETRLARPRTTPAPTPQPQPVMPQPSPLARVAAPEEGEQVIFKVRPTLLFIKLGYVLAALGGIALIALLALLGRWVAVPLSVSLPLALALLLIPAYHHLRRNSVSYTLTDSKIEIDEGLISQKTRNIPLRNIQDVTLTSTLWQRLLKFGDVVVDNASESGGKTVLRNIPDPRRHADLLLRELRRWR